MDEGGLTIPNAPPATAQLELPDSSPAALKEIRYVQTVGDETKTYRSQKVTSRKKNNETRAIDDRKLAAAHVSVVSR